MVKSTLITVLAGALAADYGYRVLVVDADSQQTLAGVRLTNDQPSVDLEREAGTLAEPAAALSVQKAIQWERQSFFYFLRNK